MYEHPTLWLAAVIIGTICFLPLLVFVLWALWPWRVLVSWLVLGLIGAAILVRLLVQVLHTVVAVKLQLAEAAQRRSSYQMQEHSVPDDSPGLPH
jgi:hypothetical protein